mmetsp:Transcript_18644/g.42608  ORF Transcript_18644/g.42608 Transcript_18644/m.42608 type:complete len:105 (+) Transcript_18644:136-450(+)
MISNTFIQKVILFAILVRFGSQKTRVSSIESEVFDKKDRWTNELIKKMEDLENMILHQKEKILLQGERILQQEDMTMELRNEVKRIMCHRVVFCIRFIFRICFL